MPVAALFQAPRESGNEILQRAEMRDAWLAVAAPVAVALLLALLLVALRQRRKPVGALTPLFRHHTLAGVRGWWRERVDAFNQHRARQRRAADEQRAADAARAAARLVAERVEREKPRLPAADLPERLPVPEMRGVLRVETDNASYEGQIIDINDAALTIRYYGPGAGASIPWNRIRRISLAQGRDRQPAIPLILTVIGGGLLGSCGWFFDELEHSTAGHYPTNPLFGRGLMIGALTGGAFGLVLMFALPGRRWTTIVDVTSGEEPLTYSTVASRAAATQAAAPENRWDTQNTIEAVARVLLVIVILGTCNVLGR